MAVYYGTFKNRTDTKDIAVYIKAGSGDEVISMGGSDDDIKFLKEPVNISYEMEDTFEVITMKTCEIGLLVKNYLGDDLFTGDARSVIVNVYQDDECIFAGFLEPNVYSQPWDHDWTSLTIRATDALATLQYYPYQNITSEDAYFTYKETCDSITALSILTDMFRAFPNLDLKHGNASTVYYDGSVLLDRASGPASIWDKVQIYELLFLGEEFDDVWQADEVIEEVLKYFNLHIRQEGLNFYIYHWASVRAGLPITWTPLLVGQTAYRVDNSGVITDQNGAYEKLVLVDDSNQYIKGNKLTEVLGDFIEEVNGEYRRYYYFVKPNGDKIKNESHYEVVDRSDKLKYIHDVSKGGYKILVQSTRGDYDYDSLDDAPQSAYSGGTFIRNYYTSINNQYIVTTS